MGWPHLFFSWKFRLKGVCILINQKCEATAVVKLRDNEGRVVAIELQILDKSFLLTNIYAPNKDDPEFFVRIIDETMEIQSQRILVGDFNTVMNSNINRKGSRYNNDKASAVLNECINKLELSDVWRDRNPGVYRHSYIRKKPHLISSRINYALCLKGLDSHVKSVMYIPSIMTDHSAFYIHLQLTNIWRGAGYWKFNDSHLTKPDFLKAMKENINAKKKEFSHLAAQEKWECLKFDIATFSQQWSRDHAAEKRVIINQLYEFIANLENEVDHNEPQKFNLLEKSKQDLNELENERAMGIIYRCKRKWTIEAERNTKYFFNLEKSRSNMKTCAALYDETTKKLTMDQKRILQMQGDYYRKLYKADPTVNFLMVNQEGPRLTEEQRLSFDKNIELLEYSQALKGMVNSKSPGLDGITASFYKMFWKELKDVYSEAMNEGIQMGILHKTARRGVINLIPKPNKDIRRLRNLRPITLLNVDYKILEKALANRLKTVMTQLINQDQKGFIKGRRISSNIRKILDLSFT